MLSPLVECSALAALPAQIAESEVEAKLQRALCALMSLLWVQPSQPVARCRPLMRFQVLEPSKRAEGFHELRFDSFRRDYVATHASAHVPSGY